MIRRPSDGQPARTSDYWPILKRTLSHLGNNDSAAPITGPCRIWLGKHPTASDPTSAARTFGARVGSPHQQREPTFWNCLHSSRFSVSKRSHNLHMRQERSHLMSLLEGVLPGHPPSIQDSPHVLPNWCDVPLL